MVDAADPRIGQQIIDPFCSTGGFLIYAFEVVSEKIRLQEFSDDEKAKWRFELPASRIPFHSTRATTVVQEQVQEPAE
jgi:hypothetical protein